MSLYEDMQAAFLKGHGYVNAATLRGLREKHGCSMDRMTRCRTRVALEWELHEADTLDKVKEVVAKIISSRFVP